MRLRGACLLLVLAAGCRGEHVMVLDRAEPITRCAEALFVGEEGDPCEFEVGCSTDSGCCQVELFCELGRLIRLEDCSGCAACVRDTDCGGLAWCVGAGECVACPPLPPDAVPCEPPLEHVSRNGCPIEACAPPSECQRDRDCGDPASLLCVTGANCPCGDESCCVNRCAPMDCAAVEAPPEGCAAPCVDGTCPTDLCYSANCVCDASGWVCEVRCALDLPPPRC